MVSKSRRDSVGEGSTVDFSFMGPFYMFRLSVSRYPLSSRNRLPMFSNVANSLFVPIFVVSSSMYFELCQFSDFHCGHFC